MAKPEEKVQGPTTIDGLSGYLVTVLDPNSVAAEAYRSLRTNLIYSLVDNPPRLIVITSSGSGESKSTVCANLGVALAQAGKNTLVIDGDLRRPVMHDIFDLRMEGGLADVLAGESTPQEAYKEPLPDLAFKVLTAGAVPPNPVELLGSRRLTEYLAGVRERFDYVLVDTAPAGLVSDPAIIAAQADGVLLTFNAQKTRRGDLRRAMRSLTAVGADVLGTVMTNVSASKGDRYQSYQSLG